jgi:hypothetical protein
MALVVVFRYQVHGSLNLNLGEEEKDKGQRKRR